MIYMNKYRITNPNNNIVRDYKSRTTDESFIGFGVNAVNESMKSGKSNNSTMSPKRIDNKVSLTRENNFVQDNIRCSQ
jgi:hypothetical protein